MTQSYNYKMESPLNWWQIYTRDIFKLKFALNACGPFTITNERINKFKKTDDL